MYVAFHIWREFTRWATVFVVALAMSAVIGCSERVPPKVVVYTSIDKEVALPLFAEFTKATGIRVEATFGSDLVGGGTGGTEALVESILAERNDGKCDVFWNDEILHTIELDRAGLLQPHVSAEESAFPAAARSPNGTWYAIARDARVLAVHKHQVAEARLPKTLYDFTDPQWYERVGLAKPLTGLASTHAACLFAQVGESTATDLLTRIKRNARILRSDREVACAVAHGNLAFGLTNSSDAALEIAAGSPVMIVYPDQGENDFGTLYIPMTVARLKDSPNSEPAAKLLDYLLSANVAKQLADSPRAYIPTRTDVPHSDRVKPPSEVHAMPADFQAAEAEWDATANTLGEMFAAP